MSNMPEKSSKNRGTRSSTGKVPIPIREAGRPEPNAADEVTTSAADHAGNTVILENGTDADAIDVIKDEKVQEYLDQRVIGNRIRSLRLKRSMGLIELGNRTGLSASFLSQLETGRVVPTLRNLARIALVFGKDLSWFFKDDKPVAFRILRQSDRVRLILDKKEESRFISESLSALVPDRNIVPCLAEFLPKSSNCEFTPKIFTGQEFVYMIEGALWIVTAREKQLVEAGDVVWIDGSTKRQYECSGDNTARAMIITFPRE
jgi:transcriptional regulator with XRE-family HTH domain